MVKAGKGGLVDKRKKQLVNLPEEHKAWITRVVELAMERGDESSQTEVLRVIVGRAMKEDPETFVERLSKARLEARLADIEHRKAVLAAEEAAIAEKLGVGTKQYTNSR